LQVRVTRNWVGHGSGYATVEERLRAMQSLMDMLGIITPIVLPRSADAANAIASIQHHMNRVQSASSTGMADLSVELHACLIFMRALEQLRTYYKDQMKDPNCEITAIIEDIRIKMKSEQQIVCKMVVKGRNYVFHGTDMQRTLGLLQCTCAVAQIFRFLASNNSSILRSRSSKDCAASAADSSNSSAGSVPPDIQFAPSAELTAADACDASVALLLSRIGISDLPSLIKEVVAIHNEM
jgi:hypothetical protein